MSVVLHVVHTVIKTTMRTSAVFAIVVGSREQVVDKGENTERGVYPSQTRPVQRSSLLRNNNSATSFFNCLQLMLIVTNCD